MHININKNFLYFDEYKVKCAIGKRGIGYKTKEGDLITPIGLFKVKFLLYRKDKIKQIKTKLKKIAIKKDMGWCDDPRSKNYNKLIHKPFNYRYEELYRKDNIYDVILVLDYNMKPIKKNKGSAIFIHIAKKKYEKTKGCIAINKKNILKIISKMKINTEIKISRQK